MANDAAQARAAASLGAKGLLDKGRADEAVAMLAAWAANGPNDVEGQNLLAEALRIDPAAPIAQLAFERMEGITGNHAVLDQAIGRWTLEAIMRVEREIRPSFVRAQVGFNNNVKYKGQTFHIQPEDSGLDKPHVITHLFADGRRILKSHKRSHPDHLNQHELPTPVRRLMQG